MRCRTSAARKYRSGIMPAPDKPLLDGLEAKWAPRWETDGTYRFYRQAPRERVYAIDTPPLTVSGSLHVGHAFSSSTTSSSHRAMKLGRDMAVAS